MKLKEIKLKDKLYTTIKNHNKFEIYGTVIDIQNQEISLSYGYINGSEIYKFNASNLSK